MYCCSIQVITNFIVIFFLILTVVGTLTPTLINSHSTAKSIAERFISTVADNAKEQANGFLVPYARTISALQRTHRRGLYLPFKDLNSNYADRENHADMLERDLTAHILQGNYSMMNLMLVYSDESAVMCRNDNNIRKIVCLWYNPYDHDGAPTPNHSTVRVRKYPGRGIHSLSDPITKQYSAVKLVERSFYLAAKDKPYGSLVYSNAFFDALAEESVYSLRGPLHDKNGVFIGVAVIIFPIHHITEMMSTLPKTDNSISFLMGDDGHPIATSDPSITSFYTIPHKKGDAIPKGCAIPIGYVTYTAEETSRLKSQLHCWKPLSELHGIASAFYDANSELTKDDSYLGIVDINGDEYYTAIRGIEAVESTKKVWRFFILIPIKDVMGDVYRGRDISIIIGVILVVITALTLTIILFFLLRPLRALAERMELASTFTNSEAIKPQPVSRIHELAQIQHSFELFASQLEKAKSFLPQTLLAQLIGGDADDADDGDESERVSTVQSDTQRSGTLASTLTKESELSSTRMANAAIASLMSKNVSVVIVNLRYFHQRVMNQTVLATLQESYATLVDGFISTAKDFHGVLDSFHGDHFVLTFNAVRANGGHAQQAAALAVTLMNQAGVLTTTGVATGMAMVGNMGSANSKRFNIVGAVYTQAMLLERLCKRFGVRVLGAGAIRDFELVAHGPLVEVIRMPGSSRPKPVMELRHLNHRDGDEWMYELEESENTMLSQINAAVIAAVDGNYAPAADLMNRAEASATPLLRRVHRAALTNAPYLGEITDYYQTCILSENCRGDGNEQAAEDPHPGFNRSNSFDNTAENNTCGAAKESLTLRKSQPSLEAEMLQTCFFNPQGPVWGPRKKSRQPSMKSITNLIPQF